MLNTIVTVSNNYMTQKKVNYLKNSLCTSIEGMHETNLWMCCLTSY